MSDKPSSLDVLLVGQPELRAEFEAAAIDPGITINKLHALIQSRGFKVSRAAVGRWRLKYMRRHRGALSRPRQHLLIAIMAMTDSEMSKAIHQLPTRLQDVDRIRQPA